MHAKVIEGRWTGTFQILAGLATQYGTLDITVAADGTFKGKAIDNNVPEVVTGKFIGSDDDIPGYQFEIHIYGPSYGGTAELMKDGSIQMRGGGYNAGSFSAT